LSSFQTPIEEQTPSAQLPNEDAALALGRIQLRSRGKIAQLTSVHAVNDIRIFHKQCCSLAKAGYDVTMVVPGEKDVAREGVQIRCLPKEKKRLARMTKTAWRCYREALRLGADLYHFHDPELIPVGLLLRAHGKKVIYDIHEDVPKDILSKQYLPVWSRKSIAWVVKHIENASCRRFSALVAATPAIRRRFASDNGNVHMVRNFPIPEELVSRTGIAWRDRDSAVTYVGGVTGLRGIREMVRAMELVPPGLNARLDLAGSAIYGDSLDDLPQLPGWARTKFHGYLDRPGIAELYGRSRAGLVLFHPAPNHMEAMPMKLFEYMAAGIPVIASDFPAWREIIEGARCGLLVDPLRPGEIAEAIEFVLTHPADAEEMGRRGRVAVRERYSWDTQADVLFDLYAQLLHSPAKPNALCADALARGPQV
jgi:glycosyltransferase involved in cell wall biosynthesis